MKKILFVLLLFPFFVIAQGASISFEKKIKDPYITISNDTINIGDVIQIKEGLNPDGTFRYVQKLNNFNEPKWFADSRNAFQIQKVKFFKQQNGVFYLFTEFFCINIEPAIEKKEIILK
jgi:hypothetical protein